MRMLPKPPLPNKRISQPRVNEAPTAPTPLRSVDRKQAIYERLKEAKKRFGLIRLEMGILLDQVHKDEIWRGRAESFGAFLEEERINTSAAYGFMRVARKFFFELQLTDSEFSEIACANMGILELAAQVIDQENKDEVIALINTLGERDAKQALLEMLDEKEGAGISENSRGGKQFKRAMNAFRDLPDDQRIEFMQKLRVTRTNNQ